MSLETKKQKPDPEDPFFGLKFIAFCRSQLPEDPEDVTAEVLTDYAKWQICKVKNILFKDPIWDDYTVEEILVEFFTIKFDESDEAKTDFSNKIRSVSSKTLDWFEQMEKKHLEEQQAKNLPPPPEEVEFEDTF